MPKIVEYLIYFMAFIGVGVSAVFLATLFVRIQDNLKDKFDEAKRKLRYRRKKLHKVKIPVYCYECENWNGGDKENYVACPMHGYYTGDVDYCSRGYKVSDEILHRRDSKKNDE